MNQEISSHLPLVQKRMAGREVTSVFSRLLMEKHLVDLGAKILGGEVEKDSFFGSQLLACAKFPYLFGREVKYSRIPPNHWLGGGLTDFFISTLALPENIIQFD